MEVCKTVMKQKNEKPISFTSYEKTCEFHFATVTRVCYCGKTDGACSKITCWKFKENEE